MTALRRAEKVVPIAEAVAAVRDGALLGVGGVLSENKPVALIRALLRRRPSGLRLIALSASGYDVDLMIAAGVVAETFIPAVTFNSGGLAPMFRAAVERGDVRANPVDVASVMAGYFASAEGLPFHPVAALRGSDVTAINPLIRPLRSPFDDEEIWAARAIAPDVAFIHVQEADVYGNARVNGPSEQGENLIARAARHVIVSCDELVPHQSIVADPRRTTIPGMYVDAVVHAPGGARPTSSPGRYLADLADIDTYWKVADGARRSGDRAALDAYLVTHVYGEGVETREPAS